MKSIEVESAMHPTFVSKNISAKLKKKKASNQFFIIINKYLKIIVMCVFVYAFMYVRNQTVSHPLQVASSTGWESARICRSVIVPPLI